MRLTCAGLALALLATGPLAGQARAAPAAASWFEYLHVEANEGGSSGGHAAIRFGEQVFHFQHRAGGLLRLHRSDADAFLHTYARLQNRTVHVQRIAVTAEAYELLRRRFGSRLVREDGEFATLAALEADRDLLREQSTGATSLLELRGGAFFAEPATLVEPALAAVTERLDALDGGDAIARRSADVARALAAPLPAPVDGDGRAAATQGRTSRLLPAAHRLAELLEADLALRVLRTRPPLRADAVRAEQLDELALTPAERAALAAHGRALVERAVALASSRRPDFGSALLLALARLATVERSLAADRLVVLDAYPRDAERLDPAALRTHATDLPALLAEARGELAAARRAFAAPGEARETRFGALEAAVNRYLELRGALVAGRDLRLARGTLLPSGTAAHPAPAFRATSRAALVDAAAAAERRADAHRARLRTRYAYDLLERNCVSEIFREIAAALAGAGAVANGTWENALDCTGSTRELGGCIDPAARLRFIPFVSAGAVADEYRVAAAHAVPSYRAARLAEMYEQENDLLVALRESNVVTSALYRSRAEDSPFLFFTDDATLARPLLGAVNLAVGLGASAAGLLALPADGGGLLLRGLRGTLFSVPELGFVSIRKGSFAYAPRAAAAGGAPDRRAAAPPLWTTPR